MLGWCLLRLLKHAEATPLLAADGRTVVFQSFAGDLVQDLATGVALRRGHRDAVRRQVLHQPQVVRQLLRRQPFGTVFLPAVYVVGFFFMLMTIGWHADALTLICLLTS